MPRKRRIVVPGLAHHVTQRGNYKQIVFEKEVDFRKYSHWIHQYAVKCQVEILAFCLMSNHVHFIVIPNNSDGLARLFNNVHMIYSQYKNEEKDRKGHLLQGRFYSCILSKEHLYRAIRHVEQNPVRANIVSKPWQYTWSSTRQHLGMEKLPIIKTKDPRETLRCVTDWKAYLEKADTKSIEEIRRLTKKELAIGSEQFLQTLENRFRCVLRELRSGRPKKK